MDTITARAWLDRWDAQQERYVAAREERFRVVVDVVSAAVAGVDRPRVVDLGCGPGSLATRVAAALPGAEVVGIDADPLLLDLARSAGHTGARFVHGYLNRPGWESCLEGPWDAVVSSTALHWLEHDELAAVFATAAARLRPGGVLVNADNMHLPGPLRAYGEHVRRSHAVRAGTTDNEDWRAWWEAVLADVDPETAAAHNALAISHDSSSDLTVTGYTDLLLRGGFSAAGPVWQVGDDHVLVAVR